MHGQLRVGLPILALLACSSRAAPQAKGPSGFPPETNKTTASVDIVATMVRVISRWSAVPPGQAIDSISVATSLGNFPLQAHTKPPTATADTALFDITQFTPGVPVGGQVSTQTIRRGIRSTTVTVTINFTRPDTQPPPVVGMTVAVDSV